MVILCCFVLFGATPAMLRGYYWLCTQELLLLVHWKPYEMLWNLTQDCFIQDKHPINCIIALAVCYFKKSLNHTALKSRGEIHLRKGKTLNFEGIFWGFQCQSKLSSST